MGCPLRRKGLRPGHRRCCPAGRRVCRLVSLREDSPAEAGSAQCFGKREGHTGREASYEQRLQRAPDPGRARESTFDEAE